MIIVSNSGDRSLPSSSSSLIAIPCFAIPYTIGKSHCSSVAFSSTNRSNTSFTTSSALWSFLSILFINRIGLRPCSRDFWRTNLVWGIGPSVASTSRITVSTVLSTRSTSEEKSLWPGVSTIFILYLSCLIEQFLEYIVIPLSCSRSLLSMTQSFTTSLSLKTPLWFKNASTRVDFPASTCAITAILIMLCSKFTKNAPSFYLCY